MPSYTPDFLNGGTASASNTANGAAANAFDNNQGTRWGVNNYTPGGPWVKYDLGSGVSKKAVRLGIYTTASTWDPREFRLQGSNNDSTWTTLVDSGVTFTTGWQYFNFSNATSYRYYRVIIDLNWAGSGSDAGIWEIELFEEASGGAFLLNFV